MIHYLKIFLVWSRRHLLYIAINLVGIVIAFVVFATTVLYSRYESSYNDWIPDHDSIYLLTNRWTLPGRAPWRSENSQGIALPLLLADFPQIRRGARLKVDQVVMRVGSTVDHEFLVSVDSDFFRIFRFPFLAGSRDRALDSPRQAVISARLAEKYFGTDPPLGRFIDLRLGKQTRSYLIVGVMRNLPANKSFGDIDLVVRFDPGIYDPDYRRQIFDDWGSQTLYTFLEIPRATDARLVQRSLPRFVVSHARDLRPYMALDLLPLSQWHFANADMISGEEGVNPSLILVLSLVGIGTLALSAMNYVNLSTVRGVARGREVAIRKVVGANRRHIRLQFLIESTFLAMVAGFLGVLATHALLPAIGTFAGIDFDENFFRFRDILLMLIPAVIVLGPVAGLYPAAVLAGVRPAGLLREQNATAHGRRWFGIRNVLISVQFMVATTFLISVSIMWSQMQFLARSELGFERQGLLLVDTFGDPALESRRTELLSAMRTIPGVTGVTMSDRAPGSGNVINVNVARADHRGPEPSAVLETVGPGYFSVYRIGLVAGRVFDPGRDGRDRTREETSGEIRKAVVNEAAIRLLGFGSVTDAVGEVIRVSGRPTEIVGIVRNARFTSPRKAVPPVIYVFGGEAIPNAIAAMRFRGMSSAHLGDALRERWASVAPDVPLSYLTAEEALRDFYAGDRRRERIFALSAVLALVLSCIGLYGISAYFIATRRREIGIRKVFGATFPAILTHLALPFLRPVLVANLGAWPLTLFLMRHWLLQFDQRIVLHAGYFVAATLIALLPPLLLVGLEFYRASSRPVNELLQHQG